MAERVVSGKDVLAGGSFVLVCVGLYFLAWPLVFVFVGVSGLAVALRGVV